MAGASDAPIGFRLAHELEGLLTGIAADGIIAPGETERLVRWVAEARAHAHVQPFTELLRHVDRALSDGRLTLEECEDLRFVASRLTTVNPHFNALRSGLQVLFGILAGVAADRVVPLRELAMLEAWNRQWRHLEGLWPYDECTSIVRGLLKDYDNPQGVQYLLQFADQFPIGGHMTVDGELPPLLITGVCASEPTIRFDSRRFVFTGASSRAERAELEAHVVSRAGETAKGVSAKVHYLVVCDEGNPFWAFACYGRKVEKACELRRAGHSIVILHESDFWAALSSQPGAN